MSRIPLLALVGLALLSGCVRRMPEPTPQDIPRLERAVEARPGDVQALTRLGIAYFKAGDHPTAQTILDRALTTGQAPGAAYLYKGLVSEELEDWAGARQAYASYVERGEYGPLKEEIQDRLTLMVRRELRARARETLAREEEIAQRDPRPGTVAVFPFRLTGESEELEPLQVALADMMTTDLALSGGLTVLERTRVRALLEEMALQEAGLTAPETGARAGRLLQAQHVVQGALTPLPDRVLRFDTDVLATRERESRGEASAQDQLSRIFDVEKEAVFQILDILAVDLTPAERQAINENRSENLLAFLAYGRGLMAMDRGDYDQARQFFGESLDADPAFGPALEGRTEAEALQDAALTSTDQVASRAMPELAALTSLPLPVEPPGSLAELATATSSLLWSMTHEVVPSPSILLVNPGGILSDVLADVQHRDPLQEAIGLEGVTIPEIGIIRITIPRPGGEN